MKYLLFILIAIMYSCSVEYHVNKAIQKGFKCDETSDTIKIASIDSIPIIIKDTIFWEKLIISKDTIIQYKKVYRPESNLEKRLAYRIKTKEIYKDRIIYKERAKAEGQKAKAEVKKIENKKTWANLNLLFLGVFVGIVLSWLLRKSIKQVI